MATMIEKELALATVVTVLDVEPENQAKVVALLHRAETAMRELPGFISASIHRSLDGTRVIVYAQWRSASDFEALSSNANMAVHMEAVAKIADFESTVCEVVES